MFQILLCNRLKKARMHARFSKLQSISIVSNAFNPLSFALFSGQQKTGACGYVRNIDGITDIANKLPRQHRAIVQKSAKFHNVRFCATLHDCRLILHAQSPVF
jgi:hypothetical protein